MLPTSERLRSNAEFQQVYQEGKSVAEGPVVLYLLRRPGSDVRMAGFSVSKKLGKAVVRNLVKRRMREAYRKLLPELPCGFMAVMIARKSAAEADYQQLETAMRRVFAKAGML